MKLLRFGPVGQEKPGVELANGQRLDVSSHISDFDPDFLQTDGLKELSEIIANNDLPQIDPTTRLGVPVNRPGKIICVGLNYEDHAREAGMEIPKEPILFFKATTSICGPNDNLVIPKNSEKTDWEVELNIVIGKETRYINKENAYDHIAGYTLTNDYSERAWQLERGGQWVKGKSCDSFSPIGPWLVTKDEVPDPNNLDLWLKVNGETMQQSNTRNFVFKVDEVVSYISQFMTLSAGDMIFTGTPPGVGMGLKPPRFIKPGDTMELGINGLGSSSQIARAYSAT